MTNTETATTARVPGTVRYTAWMDAEHLTLIRDVYAGVSGPMQSVATDEIPDLEAARVWIERQGFLVVSGWETGRNYNGLLLTARLIER